MKWFVIITAVALLGVGLYFGSTRWQARVDTAVDKFTDKIDAALDKTAVDRKEIEIKMHGLKEGLEGIRKAKIKAQVKVDQFERDAEPHRQGLAGIDRSLKIIRDGLTADATVPVALGGKNYTKPELQGLAEKLIAARKDVAAQVEGVHKGQEELQKVVATLEKKQQDMEAQVVKLETYLARIDANMAALKAMKEAAAAMGKADASSAEAAKDLEEKVRSLDADVEAGLRIEGGKWNDSEAKSKVDSVDEIIKATTPATDTVSEIDRILGTKK